MPGFSFSPIYGDAFKLGDYKKALELKEKVYALYCKVLGEKHPDTVTALNNLAITYGELGDYKKAAELFEKVYALLCKILGEEHPKTIKAKECLEYYRKKAASDS